MRQETNSHKSPPSLLHSFPPQVLQYCEAAQTPDGRKAGLKPFDHMRQLYETRVRQPNGETIAIRDLKDQYALARLILPDEDTNRFYGIKEDAFARDLVRARFLLRSLFVLFLPPREISCAVEEISSRKSVTCFLFLRSTAHRQALNLANTDKAAILKNWKKGGKNSASTVRAVSFCFFFISSIVHEPMCMYLQNDFFLSHDPKLFYEHDIYIHDYIYMKNSQNRRGTLRAWLGSRFTRSTKTCESHEFDDIHIWCILQLATSGSDK